MNDLEKELGSLEPVAPSEQFKIRVEEALGEPGKVAVRRISTEVTEGEVSTGARNTLIAYLIPLAVAAAVVVGAFLVTTWPVADDKGGVITTERLEGAPKASSASFLPSFPGQGWEASELTDHFLGARDEGVVHRTGQAPVRRYRYRFVDVTTWKHPGSNAVIRSSIPREEVVLVDLDPY